jgi:hypothetical protein
MEAMTPTDQFGCTEARWMSRKPFVYVASPYTKGDPAINTHFQCRTFDELMSGGIVMPYVPLVSHFQHTLFPRHYKDWIEYDLAILHKMDACLRLNAVHEPLGYEVSESSGADGEVDYCRKIGVPVFFDTPSLYEWAAQWKS